MSQIKVSVVIPVYNSANSLEICLESVLRQSLDELEIIIVDDGSEDESLKISQEFAAKHPGRVSCFSGDHKGVSATRNLGVSKARGDYIGFVDSDDYVHKSMFEKLHTLAERDNLDIVACRRFDKVGSSLKESVFKKEIPATQTLNIVESKQLPQLITGLSGFVWDKLFRRELLVKEVKFSEDLQYAEDVHLLMRFIYYCKRIGFLDEALYFHNTELSVNLSSDKQNDGDLPHLVKSAWEKNELDIFVALQGIVDFYQEKQLFDEVQESLCKLSIGYYNRRFRTLNESNDPLDTLNQVRFTEQAFSFLKANFPNWKAEMKNSGRRSPNRLKTSLPLIKLYIYLPKSAKRLLHPLIRRLR